MSLVILLDRLQRVRQTGPGRWIARCPAHDDRMPSLSIRELDDGRLLLHDFGGCDTELVLASLGLTMSALFPEPFDSVKSGAGYAPTHSRIPASDLLTIISQEATVAAIIASDIIARRSITDSEWSRLAKAVARINRGRDYCNGN